MSMINASLWLWMGMSMAVLRVGDELAMVR
jgi:hypothetical protein